VCLPTPGRTATCFHGRKGAGCLLSRSDQSKQGVLPLNLPDPGLWDFSPASSLTYQITTVVSKRAPTTAYRSAQEEYKDVDLPVVRSNIELVAIPRRQAIKFVVFGAVDQSSVPTYIRGEYRVNFEIGGGQRTTIGDGKSRERQLAYSTSLSLLPVRTHSPRKGQTTGKGDAYDESH